MPQILSLLDENHGNDIVNRTNQLGNRMKTMTYLCLQILFVSLLNSNRSSFYPHVNHFFISVIFPLILGKYFVKLIWKLQLNLNEISSYAQWQCSVVISEIFPTENFFRQIDLQYHSTLVKKLIWRNFCKKSWGKNLQISTPQCVINILAKIPWNYTQRTVNYFHEIFLL